MEEVPGWRARLARGGGWPQDSSVNTGFLGPKEGDILSGCTLRLRMARGIVRKIGPEWRVRLQDS